MRDETWTAFVERNLTRLTACFACIAILSTAASAEQPKAQAIAAHTRFLADDLLEGRGTGARGYDIAAAYVAAQFEAMGLKAAGDQGSYFQTLALRVRTLEQDGVRFTLRDAAGAQAFENGKEIAVDASPHLTDEAITADLAFVGWGIKAPTIGMDDYAGLDVRGKAVVLLEGAPANLPGAVRAHYSWMQQKQRMAAEHGAVAVLTIKPPARERVLPWDVHRRLRLQPQISWSHVNGPSRTTRATITLGPDVTKRIFASAGRNVEEIYTESETRPPRGFMLPASMTLQRRSVHQDARSANVIGLLPGTTLPNEYVAVVAHLDHLGIGPEVKGDNIYNGAVDNAGGVAVMIEAARALKAARPKRSILFIATTGEEKGLVGSDYFVAHPTVPMRSVVAAVSIDGLMAFHDFKGIIALGADHSTLGPISERAARAIGAHHVPDPNPARGNLALSDQYPFLRLGIPVLFPNPDRGADAPGTDAWDDYDNNRYHQPSDDMKLALRWDVAERWARYVELVLSGTANEHVAPTWYENDPLADEFARDRQRARRPR